MVFRRRGWEEKEQLCELIMDARKIRFVLLEIAPLLTKSFSPLTIMCEGLYAAFLVFFL